MKPIVALFLVLFGSTIAHAFDEKAIAKQALENHIQPGYYQLLLATSGFQISITGYCTQPSEKSVKLVYAAFGALVHSWGRIEHIRFGAITEKHRHERVLYWPDPKALGKRQVLRMLRRKQKSVLSADTLVKKSVALQGLGALEVLLFSKQHQRLFGDKPDLFKCNYAKAIAENLAQIATKLVAEWKATGTYGNLWLNPGLENPLFLSKKEPVKELILSYQVALEDIRNRRLVPAMGVDPSGKSRKNPPFHRSGLSLLYLTANIEGVESLYLKTGLHDALNAKYAGLGDSYKSEFKKMIETLQRIPFKPGDRFSDPSIFSRLISVGFPLKSLNIEGTAYLKEVAGITLGFNASDGD